MLSLASIKTFVPDTVQSVVSLNKQTGLPIEMLALFRTIYGLHTVPVWGHDIISLLAIPLQALLHDIDYDEKNVKYIFYPHTTAWSVPYGIDLINTLKQRYHLKSSIQVGTTLQKCVSLFKVLEMLKIIFSVDKSVSALVVTGEIAFTPQLRVVPRSTIVGDAATAVLIQSTGDDHVLQSVINHFVPGFSKGIYLSPSELSVFDTQFILLFSQVILRAVHDANLTLSHIALVLPHNVNILTWKKMASILSISFDKIYCSNISRLGHCFCSDHLINLQDAIHDQQLKKGDYYLMAGCGLGFYLSAAVFKY